MFSVETPGERGTTGPSIARNLHQKDPSGLPALGGLIRNLNRIRASMLELESSVDLRQFSTRRKSARNLLHYVALRRQDIRGIQENLALMGLSSLGRSESHVLYNLNAVLMVLQDLAHKQVEEGQPTIREVTPFEGRETLRRNADALFGPMENGRTVRMMVTMPSEAATDYELVRDLVSAGMDCMRINCAHDTEQAWLSMVENLRSAEREVGRHCRVLMDVAGPKLRTGPLEPGPRVMRLKARRDPFGAVTSRARAIIVSEGSTQPPADEPIPILKVRDEWFKKLEDGSEVKVKDSRGAKRSMIVSQRGKRVGVESAKTIYLDADTKLILERRGKKYSTSVLNIPNRDNPIILKKGESLTITASQEAGRPATRDEPARISCTLPEAFRFVKPGQRIWLDDGKIGGVVRSASDDALGVEVTHVAPEGGKLAADKGINLPDTNLRLPPMTPKDIEDLRFIVDHADIVGYSFVHVPGDIQVLRTELAKLGREDMGIILKIETRKAFEQLPSLLLESMRGPLSGVMIARGDLAVECGYERLAEVQEEILWMCEAAHMPSIWATQVLEGLTKNGVPSRAEVTDAAMGERSECVMLNKGPHVVDALIALDSILRRMQAHQAKKSSLMRGLSIADSFFKSVTLA